MAASTGMQAESDNLKFYEWNSQGYYHAPYLSSVWSELIRMGTFHMLVWNFLCNLVEIILSAHQGVSLNCSFSGNYTEHFLF
jgi:hypothetical protein